MFKFLVPAIALVLTPVASYAGVENAETYIQDDFDVAGITLGMQPNDVVTEMDKRGYTMIEAGNFDTIKGPSFDELVQIMAGDLDEDSASDSWKEMTFLKGTEEGVYIRFVPLPTGTAAYEIYYVNMSPAMTKERFMKAVEGKYGKAPFTARNGGTKKWSDMKLIGGDGFDVNAGAIQLTAKDGSPHRKASAFQRIKASLSIRGGKISKTDPEEIAKNWTDEPETTF